MRFPWVLTVAGLGVGLGPGCAGHRPPAAAMVPDDPAGVLAELTARASRPVLLDGVIAVTGRSQGQRLRARLIAVIEPGGRLYLESVSSPGFVLAADGERVRVLFREEREWLEEKASAATVEALIGLRLDPEALGALLSGTGVSAAMLREGRMLGGGRLEVALGILTLAPDGVGSGALDGLRFECPDPRRLEVEVKARRLELTLRLPAPPAPEATPNPDSLFRPQPPAGFRRLRLEDLRTPVLLPTEVDR